MYDQKTILMNNQAITVSAASANPIDLKGAGVLDGMVKRRRLIVRATETFTASAAATLTVALQHSATDSAYADTAVKTAAIGKATLVAGYKILEVDLPNDLKEFIQVYATVATGPFTAGKLFAAIDVD